ncbi:Alpha-tocopherol transfer protein-like protein [Cyphomyrmex costatus]|uniref:Alpha-tocopherol transfer protein-like protein n=2 Tax=Cyphomyrmex costatus TaxID=456900 RepID=A0A151ILR2_9HYME|nr:Alpha-tocopherol transfer protein-like protein [Cyphomyrmex costatus]
MIEELSMKNCAMRTSSVYGVTFIGDAINPTIHHIFQFGPSLVMKIVHAWQNCYPIRLQLINIINAPKLFDITFKIFKSFMSEKLKRRFHVYPHMRQTCFKDIPANILPVEYGGSDGTIQELTEYWKKLLEDNRDLFTSNKND